MSKVNILKTFLVGGCGGAGGVLITKTYLGDLDKSTPRHIPPIAAPEPLVLEERIEEPVDNKRKRRGEILKYGVPDAGLPQVMEYENHVLAYDTGRRTPRWVAEHLTSDAVSRQEANRKLSKFRSDPAVPVPFTASNKDYWNSGWSRGHMAPAGDNKHSQAAMNDTFLLTNVVPQDLDNNGNYWNRLEIYTRGLTDRFRDVYVISGPLWLPRVKPAPPPSVEEGAGENTTGGGSSRPRPPAKFVKYQVIGDNNVAVPTHLYKVLLVEDPSLDRPLWATFVVPNSPIEDKHLKEFQVDVGELENSLGLKLHADLDRNTVGDLCEVDGCEMQNYKEFQQFFWKRRLSSPWNIRNLEKDWKEANRKGIVTPELEKVYRDKKIELLDKLKIEEEKKEKETEEKPKVVPSEEQKETVAIAA